MYAWATPTYMLDEMSLQQWAKYYQLGWKSRETEARVFWGVLGEALSKDKHGKKPVSIKDFRQAFPGGEQTEDRYTVMR